MNIYVQCDETRAHHVHSGRTTQYLRHPLTLKAVIWCVPPDGFHKKYQSCWTSSSRNMAKYVGEITKKEREGKSPQNDQKSRKIDHYSENTGPNELKFRLVLGFRHRMPHTKFQPACFRQYNCVLCDVQSDSLMCNLLYY